MHPRLASFVYGVRKWLGTADLLYELAEVRSLVRSVLSRLGPDALPNPFACMLVCGRDQEGREQWLGTTHGGEGVLQTMSQRPLTHVRVIVFADLSRVRVGGIFYGTTLVQGDIGETPCATIPEIVPGVWIRAQVTPREKAA